MQATHLGSLILVGPFWTKIMSIFQPKASENNYRLKKISLVFQCIENELFVWVFVKIMVSLKYYRILQDWWFANGCDLTQRTV